MNTISLILLLANIWISPYGKPKISEWRGPDRTGVYNESNLLKSWPAEGPAELWSIDNIGEGFGSPVFTEDRFYITGEIDSVAILFCFNLKGEKIWQTKLGREWMRSCPGSRSAPTVVDDMIYTGTGMGNLFCLKSSNGRIVWSKDLAKDFGGILPLHGHSESPVVEGDKIFWTPGGKVHNVVAINRYNGKIIWSNPGMGETSAYNQPKLIRHKSGDIFVTFSSYHMMGFDAKTGRMLWSHEQDNFPVEKRGPGYGDTHSNSIIYENGTIFYGEGDGNCGVRLDISDDGKSIKQVWRNTAFDGYMGGIVKLGDFIYGCGTAKPELRAISASTGELTDSCKIGSGALISADNMCYYYNTKGEMMLLRCVNGKIEKISSFRIRKGTMQHFAHPVINNGILYQRHGKVLMAFDIRKK